MTGDVVRVKARPSHTPEARAPPDVVHSASGLTDPSYTREARHRLPLDVKMSGRVGVIHQEQSHHGAAPVA